MNDGGSWYTAVKDGREKRESPRGAAVREEITRWITRRQQCGRRLRHPSTESLDCRTAAARASRDPQGPRALRTAQPSAPGPACTACTACTVPAPADNNADEISMRYRHFTAPISTMCVVLSRRAERTKRVHVVAVVAPCVPYLGQPHSVGGGPGENEFFARGTL